MPIVLVLPGFSSMVPVARMAVRNLLPDCPRGDDVELIISELATNAVRHSTSRGGQFEVRLDIKPGHLRIEVRDGGPFGYPPPAPPKAPTFPTEPWTTLYDEDRHRDRAAEAEEYARGLTVIDACCDDWGHNRYPDHAIWWAELAWPEPTDPNAAEPNSEHEPEPDVHPASGADSDA